MAVNKVTWSPFGYRRWKWENLGWVSQPCMDGSEMVIRNKFWRKVISSNLDILSSKWPWDEIWIEVELDTVIYDTDNHDYGQPGRKGIKRCSTWWGLLDWFTIQVCSGLRSFLGCRRDFQCQNWDSTRQARMLGYSRSAVPYHLWRKAIEYLFPELRSLD